MTIKTKKIFIRTARVFLALVVLGLIVRGILDFTTGKRLESAIREMKTEGKRLSVQDFAPKCRDVDNAALLWQGIESMFVKDFDSPAVINSPLKSLQEGKSLNPETQARIEESAKKYGMLFLLIREAANKLCFRYARRWKNVSFGLKYIDLKKLAPLLRLFLLKAYVQAEKGGQSLAVQDCLVGLRNLSFFDREPHPFNRFIGPLLFMENLDVLRSVLMKGNIDERTCQSVLDELNKLQPQETLKLSLQLEQAMILEEYMSYLRGVVRENLMDKVQTWLFKPMLKAEALFVLNLGNDLNNAVSEPYYGPRKLLGLYLEKAKSIPRIYRMAGIFHPSIGNWLLEKYARLEAMIDVTRTAMACRLYLLRHGRIPETLSQLAPENLAEISVDPFTGRSLVYRSTPKGFILYSLGPNQKDDGGSGAWGWGIKTGDDIAWKE
jgi:hypothetical protein